MDDGLVTGFDAEAKWSNAESVSPVRVLFLARLERAKGVFETIEAVKILVENKLWPQR